jgi:starch-binding outer membrane protein, SusD/RagB family
MLVCISPILWRNPYWLTDDKRRTADLTSTPGNMVYIPSSGIVYTSKFKDITTFSDAAPVIRYAEVLLNLAEAYARRNGSGDFTLALQYLNQVRNRSLANPTTQAYTAGSFADNTALINAILAERRIEFCSEGRRWADIHRLKLDVPAKLANATPATGSYTLGTPYSGALTVVSIPYDNYKYLWPIPIYETNANPTLAQEQNPGW